jgi:hypothetical protein
MRSSEPYSLLKAINERHPTSFQLLGRFSEGENQGAFALFNYEGAQFVLKYSRKSNWHSRIGGSNSYGTLTKPQ